MKILALALSGGVSRMPHSGMALAGWSSCEALKRILPQNDELIIKNIDSTPDKRFTINQYHPDVILVAGIAWHQFKACCSDIIDSSIPIVPHIISGDVDWFSKPDYLSIIQSLAKCPKIVCRSVLTMCHFLWHKFHHIKLEYIPEAFDVSIFTPCDQMECRRKYGIPLDTKIVGFFGGPSKGANENVKAFNALLASRPELQDHVKALWIYSSHTNANNLIDTFLKQSDHILTANQSIATRRAQKAQTMSELINCCDVISIPSTHEGFGRVHVEAQLCGVPLITCKSYGTSCYENILDGETGIAVKSKCVGESHCKADVPSLMDAMYTLCTDEKLRLQMSTKARSWSLAKYNYEVVGRKLLAVLKGCL